jgi:hypothetical protein
MCARRPLAKGKIDRTILLRISADETLDFGEDTLKKVAIQLADAALSAEDEAEIRKIKAEIGLSEKPRINPRLVSRGLFKSRAWKGRSLFLGH